MKTKYSFLFAIVIVLSIILSGCTTMRYSGNGKSAPATVSFDIRVAKAVDKQAQDYHRSKRVGFTATNKWSQVGVPRSFVDLSADQKKIVQLIGIPEYERSFPNQAGKRVEEWIYLDQDYLVQFVYNRLVYLGPVDDKEKTLIELGPPTDIYAIDVAGMRKEVFIYKPRFEIHAFHQDKRIIVQ